MDMGSDTPNIQWANSQQLNIPVDLEISTAIPRLSFWNEAAPFVSDDEDACTSEPAGRFTILDVDDRSECKILIGRAHHVILRGAWVECDYRPGMRVRVYDNLSDAALAGCAEPNPPSPGPMGVSPCCTKKTYVVDDTRNGVVVEDDVLPVTCFCTALECINNPLLSRMVADLSFEYSHPAALLGKIVHEVMQLCIVDRKSSLPFIVATARRLIATHDKELYACNTSDKMLLNDFLKCVKHIVRFLEMRMNISTAEQGVLSRDLGLRGYLDCYGPEAIVEIKTGRCQQVSHRAQLLLYTLLVMEGEGLLDADDSHGKANGTRVDGWHTLHTLASVVAERASGKKGANGEDAQKPPYKPALYYVKTGELVNLSLRYSEIASLLQLRNKVAVTKQIAECCCPELRPCRVYRKIQDLHESHFLRMQLEGIEEEYRANARYHKAVVSRCEGVDAVLKFINEVPAGDYLSLYSKTHKRIADGTVCKVDGQVVQVKLREQLSFDRVVYVCADRCEVFYRYMRWSLLNLAYPKCFQSYSPGALKGIKLPSEGVPTTRPSGEDTSASDDLSLSGCSFDSDAEVSSSACCDMASPPGKSAGKEFTAAGGEAAADSGARLSIHPHEVSVSDDTGLSDIEFSDSSQAGKDMLLSGLSPDEKSRDGGADSENSIDSNFSLPADSLDDNGGEQPDKSLAGETKAGAISSVDPRPDPGRSPLVESATVGRESKRQRIAFNHADIPPIAGASAESLPCTASGDSIEIQTPIPEPYKDDFGRLNDGQRQAIIKALSCTHFSTVHGMPGTGKSTSISLLIKILAFYGKKVLVVCYTHFAIENIIRNLGGLPYYRANWAGQEELRESIASSRVVFGTCFCFSDPVFIGNKFDFCIIDEGSQMHLLLALVPMSLSERVCVVGDHHQLKPLAKRSGAMQLSIFEHLMEGCSVLRRQYRMNEEIMRLSNTLFYGQQLLNGRGPDGESSTPSVVFIDTDRTALREAVALLKPCTILCYFNSTVRELKMATDLPVTTVDRFQGSEDCRIAVVFDPVKPCGVIESRERLNVALTRARDHLTLIGSRCAMQDVGVLRELLDIL